MVQQKPKPKTRRVPTKHDNYKESIELLAKNDNQALYIEALNESDQVVVFGPSGCGKTYMVATFAANAYNLKMLDKIVITRPHVAVGKDIGFLPGTLEEKCAPWALPVVDVLERHLGKGVVETAFKNGNIETVPLALIRGRSFDNTLVIVDEAQNLTVDELKALVTRVGMGSKLVINGDVQQSDLKERDGLTKIVHLVKKYQLPIPIIEFGVDDIIRSDITKTWVKTFMSEGI
jgi:phosphate starvation-inducible protein PhoH and related proteins